MHILLTLALILGATTVDLTPLVEALTPFAVGAVGVFASWALHRIAQKLHIDALDSHRAVLASAIENGVALALKRVPTSFSADARIAAAVNYITPKVPDALAALKVTPESLREIIAARLPA